MPKNSKPKLSCLRKRGRSLCLVFFFFFFLSLNVSSTLINQLWLIFTLKFAPKQFSFFRMTESVLNEFSSSKGDEGGRRGRQRILGLGLTEKGWRRERIEKIWREDASTIDPSWSIHMSVTVNVNDRREFLDQFPKRLMTDDEREWFVLPEEGWVTILKTRRVERGINEWRKERKERNALRKRRNELIMCSKRTGSKGGEKVREGSGRKLSMSNSL